MDTKKPTTNKVLDDFQWVKRVLAAVLGSCSIGAIYKYPSVIARFEDNPSYYILPLLPLAITMYGLDPLMDPAAVASLKLEDKFRKSVADLSQTARNVHTILKPREMRPWTAKNMPYVTWAYAKSAVFLAHELLLDAVDAFAQAGQALLSPQPHDLPSKVNKIAAPPSIEPPHGHRSISKLDRRGPHGATLAHNKV